MIKVRIQRGQLSIDVEGSFSEVDTVLTRYWLPVVVEPEEDDEVPDPGPSSESEKSKKTRSQKARPKRVATAGGDSGPKNSIDPEQIANGIKTHAQFSAIKTKILDEPGDWINKCRLIALLAEEPITSGDVQRSLNVLRIRSALSTLSTTLSSNSTEFLTTGSNPVKYRMTSSAESAFKKWLTDGDE